MVLFLFGWTRFLIAILATAAMIYGLVEMYKSFTKSKSDEADFVSIDVVTFVVVLLFLMLVGCYSGWGRYVIQAGDWGKHNAVLADLVNKDWPVYYQNNNSGNSMLTYYIAQYLVPALIGKIYHDFRMAEVAQYFWATLGLVLVYLNLIRVFKICRPFMQMVSAFILCFFSGPLLLAQKLVQYFVPTEIFMGGNDHYLAWDGDIILQYSSNFVLLRWVFPQILVCWMTMLLLYEHRKELSHYVIFMLPAMLFGTLSFVGIMPICLGTAIYTIIAERKDIVAVLKRLFSLSNILNAVFLGSIMISYFLGNVTGEKPDAISFRPIDYSGRGYIYIIFVGCMVMIYAICLFERNKRNIFYWLALVTLLVLPLFTMGSYNDLVMRTSIPALFIMMMLCVEYLDYSNNQGFYSMKPCLRVATVVMVVAMMIGAIHEQRELFDLIIYDDWKELPDEINYGTLEYYTDKTNPEIPDDLKYNYYTYDLEKDFFYNYFARTRDE